MTLPRSFLLLLWRRTALVLVVLLGFAAASCDEDQATLAPAEPNIVKAVESNSSLSILAAAIAKADLATTLSGTGPLTVLAPTNEAFSLLSAPFNSIANINAIPAGDARIATLRDLLLYHVLASQTTAATFPNGASAQTTRKPASATAGVNDNTVYVSKTGTTITLNGTARIVEADASASNGVVHTIDRVLMPPTSKISDFVAAGAIATPAQFTLLQAALQRPAAAELLTLLSANTSNLTVFVPTDAAFQELLTQLRITSLDQIPEATLVNVLRQHIVSTRVFTSDLTNGQTVAALSGPLTVGIANTSVTVRGVRNPSASSIITTNILATNGVIHIIDQVLLP